MAQKGYTTKTKIENYLLKTIDASYDTQIARWIEGMEQVIDKMTNRNFIADSIASARVFGGDGTPELMIDECVAITKVEVGNDEFGSSFTEVPASGAGRYFSYPENATLKGVPFYKVSLFGDAFPCGMQNNRITAKWGYSAAVPADIEFVATVFVAGIINQQILGGDEIKSEKIGNYQITYNTDNDNDSWADFNKAMDILKSYTRILI